jgi:hypothetical protein
MGVTMSSPSGTRMEEVKDVQGFVDKITEELGRGNSLFIIGVDDVDTVEKAVFESAKLVGFNEPLEVSIQEFIEELKPLALIGRAMQGLVVIPQFLIHIALAKNGVIYHVIINGEVSYNILIGITHEWYYLIKVSRERPEENAFVKTKATPISIVMMPTVGGNNEQ